MQFCFSLTPDAWKELALEYGRRKSNNADYMQKPLIKKGFSKRKGVTLNLGVECCYHISRRFELDTADRA